MPNSLAVAAKGLGLELHSVAAVVGLLQSLSAGRENQAETALLERPSAVSEASTVASSPAPCTERRAGVVVQLVEAEGTCRPMDVLVAGNVASKGQLLALVRDLERFLEERRGRAAGERARCEDD